LLKSADADRKVIRQAIERLQEIALDDYTFEQHFNIGLAYLNEKNFVEGMEHLRAAARLNPNDSSLRAQISVLEKQISIEKEAAEALKKQPVVMVIDDSPTIRKLVAVTLERQGYKVVIAADGMQAISKLNETSPDLVLLDINMPYMDGHQVCKVLKGNSATKQVPIVMLSGKDGFIDKVRARISGATEFITKPVDPNILLAVVQKYFKSQR
jgi:twitching motility two-component system response regulator PilG